MLIADSQHIIHKRVGIFGPTLFIRKIFKKCIFLIIIVPILLYPQNIEFFGTVLDSTSKEPLIGVNIFNPTLNIGTTSNDNGYFFISLNNSFNDSIQFIFQYVGYKSKKVKLDQKEKFYIIELVPSPLQSNEIQVLGLKYNSHLSFKRVSPLQVKQSSSFLEPDIFRFLTTQASVSFTDDISNRIYVRGFRSDKLLILFDDFVLYNPYHLLNVVSSIDVGSLKAIEFYKAVYPVNYSGRVGGLLKVYSKIGNQKHFGISLDASLISSIVRIEGPIPKGAYYISLRRTYIDFFTRLFSDEFPYSFYDGIANVQIEVTKKHKLKISGIFNKDFYNKDKNAPSNWSNQAFGLNWKSYVSKYFYVHQNTYLSRYYASFLPDSSKYMKNEIVDISYKMDVFYHLKKFSSLVNLGFSLNHYDLNFNTNEPSMQIFNQKIKALLINNVYLSTLLKYQTNAEFEIGSSLSFTNYSKKVVLEPLIRFKYLFANNMTVEIGVAQKSQHLFTINNEKDIFPPFNIWQLTPKNIGAELSQQFSLGIQKEVKNFFFETELYYNNLSRIVDFNRHYLRPNDKKFLKNRGESYGLEASLHYNYNFCSIDVNYTLSKTIYSLEGNETYYPAFHRLNKLDISVFFNRGGKWNFGMHWVYASGRPFTGSLGFYSVQDYCDWNYYSTEKIQSVFKYTDPQFKVYYSTINQMRYPAYHRLDLHFEYLISKKNKIYLDILNVYNRRNVLYYEYDIYHKKQKITRMMPFLPSLGLSLNF